METGKRKSVDLLVEQFWKQGYMTLSRKYGTYLPEPSRVGDFEVDIIARQKRNYAIGITLDDAELNDPSLISKLTFLATRQTKSSNKKVLLFIGVPMELMKNAKVLLEILDPEVRKNIKLSPIAEKQIVSSRRKRKEKVLFS